MQTDVLCSANDLDGDGRLYVMEQHHLHFVATCCLDGLVEHQVVTINGHTLLGLNGVNNLVEDARAACVFCLRV